MTFWVWDIVKSLFINYQKLQLFSWTKKVDRKNVPIEDEKCQNVRFVYFWFFPLKRPPD
jgi:predicted double-glycine peptidase